jgi:hypothetical protein
VDGAPDQGGKLICELPYEKERLEHLSDRNMAPAHGVRGVHDLFFSWTAKSI